MNYEKTYSSSNLEALQSRLALRITSHLGEGTRELPHDIAERLRAGRERALEQARLARRVEAAGAGQHLVMAGRSAALGSGGPAWWVRFASVLPLIALVGGLVLIQHLHVRSQIEAAAEIDADLLADDLPPTAYSDAGFVEFLKTPRD